jgi:AGZA family xanthine/uracil permease-like MFS transporter
MAAIIPLAAVAPILVFVGISMVATAFQSNEKKYFPAVAIAMLPYFANYVMTRFNNAAGEVVAGISKGIVPLGQGAMFTAIVLGAITVYVIDQQYRKAAYFSLVGALLSFVGFMHAPKLAINASPEFAVGYVLVSVFLVYCAYQHATSTVKADNKILVKQQNIAS